MRHKKTANKKVLLVADIPVLSEGAIVHGLNLSNRMNASLEVLHLIRPESAESAKQSVESNKEESGRVKQFEYIQLVGEQNLIDELINYADGRRDLLCVVLCEQGEQVVGNIGKKSSI
ncbi:MAG: hypothetical protein D3924_05890, partial [Candidatus Electrothrix sp. AR4]|nr:hypothetical protein [Candidatus Electrothrix sp. AR4]